MGCGHRALEGLGMKRATLLCHTTYTLKWGGAGGLAQDYTTSGQGRAGLVVANHI